MNAKETVMSNGNGRERLQTADNFYTESELTEVVHEAMNYGMREALSGIRDLDTEDIHWRRIGENTKRYDLDSTLRLKAVDFSRELCLRNPIASQTMGLWRDFVVGHGIELSASNDAARRVLVNFLKNPLNRSLLSLRGQALLHDRWFVDGEVPIVLVNSDTPLARPRAGKGGNILIRTFDSTETTTVIRNEIFPDDVMGYERTYVNPLLPQSRNPVRDYYADWSKVPDPSRVIDETLTFKADNNKIIERPVVENAVMLNNTLNTIGLRGNPQLLSSIAWINGHRRFMEARAAIEQTLARFLMQAKVKRGGKNILSSVRAKLRSSLATDQTGNETNPPAPAGSVMVTGEGVDWSQIKTDSGARAADIDGKMLLQMAALGGRVYPNTLGHGDTSHLTDMLEAPVVRAFEMQRARWHEMWREIIGVVYAMAGVPEASRDIDVSSREVVKKDVAKMLEAVTGVFSTAPWLFLISEVVVRLLSDLGIDNADAVWEREKGEVMSKIEKLVDSRSEKLAQGNAGRNPANQDGNANQAGEETDPDNPTAKPTDGKSGVPSRTRRGK